MTTGAIIAIIAGVLVFVAVVFAVFKCVDIYNESNRRMKDIRMKRENLKAEWASYNEVKGSNNYQDVLNPFYHSEAERRMEADRQKLVKSEQELNALIADYNGFIKAFPTVIFASVMGLKEISIQRREG